MKIKSRKVISYLVLNVVLISMYFVTLFISPEILNYIGKWIIISTFANNITFIGGVTLDKWIKSKYFNDKLFNQGEGF